MQTTNAGQIINILSNDMNRFDTVSINLHYLWIAPIQVIIKSLYLRRQDEI